MTQLPSNARRVHYRNLIRADPYRAFWSIFGTMAMLSCEIRCLQSPWLCTKVDVDSQHGGRDTNQEGGIAIFENSVLNLDGMYAMTE